MVSKFIPHEILSGNRFTNQWSRNGMYFYKNYRKAWFLWLGYFFKPIHRLEVERKIAIIRVLKKKQRRFDMGNLIHGAKPIPDFLQITGWVWNDSPRWFDCRYEQIKLSEAKARFPGLNIREPGTVIQVFGVNGNGGFDANG